MNPKPSHNRLHYKEMQPTYRYRAELDRVVDDDTLDVLIDLGFYIKIKERIRLEGEVSQLVSWIVGSLGVGWDTLLIYRTCGNLCTNLLSLEGRGFTP